MKNVFKILPVALVGLALGACAMSMPGVVATNGLSSVGNPRTHEVKAQASWELLFGTIGLNETGGEAHARQEIRDSIDKQCPGGRIENAAISSSIENDYVYAKGTVYESATCVMPKQ